MDNHLACACSTRLKTTLLMDRFERRDENGQPLYRELHLTDCFCVCRQGGCYAVSLWIERWDWRGRFQNDFMTFSRFKQNIAGRCFSVCGKGLPAVIQQIFLQKDWEVGRFLFPDAVLLHAQRSADRAGFGSSIRTGIKRYGETGQYLITGATLRRVSCEGRRHSDKNTRARCKTHCILQQPFLGRSVENLWFKRPQFLLGLLHALFIVLNFAVQTVQRLLHLLHTGKKLLPLLNQNLFPSLLCTGPLLEQLDIFDQRLYLDPCAAHAFDEFHPSAILLRIIPDAALIAMDVRQQADPLIITQRIRG